MLTDEDREYLSGLGYQFEVTEEGRWTNLVLKDYRLPAGFDHATTDLLVRLQAGFPDSPPDMFWVDPEVRLTRTGAHPNAASNFETYIGRRWQRFSRHLAQGAWRPGIDDLSTWLAAIKQKLIEDVS